MKGNRIKITLVNMTNKEIDMSDYTTIPEDMFTYREDILKIVLPDGVKEICNNAFEGCVKMEEIHFPESLEKIGKEAFLDCVNLKTADFSDKVQVDDTAFNGCKKLVR